MMKLFCCITILLSLVFQGDVKKRTLPYAIIISKADLIVEGRIIEKEKDSYQFKITEFVKGDGPKTINVEVWQEWTCDKRIEPIEKGQRLLLFLQSEKENYSIINGSTGELFILGNNTVKTFIKDDFPKIKELKEGIRLFLKTFEYHGDLYPDWDEEYYFKRLLPQSNINRMVANNEFMTFLVSQMDYYEIK